MCKLCRVTKRVSQRSDGVMGTADKCQVGAAAADNDDDDNDDDSDGDEADDVG